MRKKSKHEERTIFLEEMAILCESMGLPRMAGRIMGQLLICNPPHQSAAELAEVVGASKGSMSSMLRLLTQAGVAERLGIPGRRCTYYQIRPGSWTENMRSRMKHIVAFKKLAERGLALINGADPALKKRLEEMHNLHAFWEKEIPALLSRYEQKHGAGSK